MTESKAFGRSYNDVLSFEMAQWLRKRGRPMRPRLTRDQKRELRECFEFIDEDKSGAIELDELMEAFKLLNVKMTEKEARRIMLKVDRDNSGAVEFAEFVEIMTTTIAEQEGDSFKKATEAPQTSSAFRSTTARFRPPPRDPSTEWFLRQVDIQAQVRRERREQRLRELQQQQQQQGSKAEADPSDTNVMNARVLPFNLMATAYRRQRVLDAISTGDLTVLKEMYERYVAEKEETERRAEIQRMIAERNKESVFVATSLDRNKRANAIAAMLRQRRVGTVDPELEGRLSGDASSHSSDVDGSSSSGGASSDVESEVGAVAAGLGNGFKDDKKKERIVLPADLEFFEWEVHPNAEAAGLLGTRGSIQSTGHSDMPPADRSPRDGWNRSGQALSPWAPPDPSAMPKATGRGNAPWGMEAVSQPSGPPPGISAAPRQRPTSARGPSNLNQALVTSPAKVDVPLRWGRPPSASMAPRRTQLRSHAEARGRRPASAAATLAGGHTAESWDRAGQGALPVSRQPVHVSITAEGLLPARRGWAALGAVALVAAEANETQGSVPRSRPESAWVGGWASLRPAPPRGEGLSRPVSGVDPRPASARPVSARPVSARPASARPGRGGVGSSMREAPGLAAEVIAEGHGAPVPGRDPLRARPTTAYPRPAQRPESLSLRSRPSTARPGTAPVDQSKQLLLGSTQGSVPRQSSRFEAVRNRQAQFLSHPAQFSVALRLLTRHEIRQEAGAVPGG